VMAQQPTTPSQSSTVPNQSPTAPNQSWELLRQLQAGEYIEAERKTGKKKVFGNFVSLLDTELVIRHGFRDESLSRDEVKNIWRVKRPNWKLRLLFAVIGGGAVYLSGLSAGRASELSEGQSLLLGLLTFAMIPVGAVLSMYIFTRKGSKRILIYSAP
jgi:hypothetical protein